MTLGRKWSYISILDPSMFELKFPNTDIEVRVIGNSGGSIY